MYNDSYLSDNEIVEVINEYINSDIYNYAVLIDGSWGSGKTFFVRNTLMVELEKREEERKRQNEGDKVKKVIYISLYGIKSTLDISNSLYLELLSDRNKKENINISRIVNSTIKIGADYLKSKGIDISNFEEVIGGLINFKDYIIIFDDLERCNCDINEVLGYINNFVEHDGVKVILVANEDEIGKCNESQNIELKYLVATNSNIDYKLEKERIESIFNLDTNEKDKKPDVFALRDRCNELFGQNILYNRIKEKLIGITITYRPNLLEIERKLINSCINDNNLKEVLYTNLNDNISFAVNRNHINLRTYQFFLSKINVVNKIVIEHYKKKEDYNLIIGDLVKACYKTCVLYKCGDYRWKWNDKNLYGEKSPIGESDILRLSIFAFKFLDDFIINSKLDKNIMIKTIDSYLKEKKQELENPNDPLNKYSNWWGMDEKDLRIGIEEIIYKLKNGEYEISVFPKILIYFIKLNEIGFEEELLNEVVKSMNELIDLEKNIISLNEEKILLNEENNTKKYEELIEPMRKKIKEKNQKNEKDAINSVFDDEENWGNRIYAYNFEKDDLRIRKESFINKIDINKLKKALEESDVSNIVMFRYAIHDLYSFSNIKDFYSDDAPNIKELKEYIKIIEPDEKDLIKRTNLKWLLQKLEEVYNALIK